MKVCILMLFMAAPLFGQIISNRSITGTVTNLSGDGIPGVKVCSCSYCCRLTDANGKYEINGGVVSSPYFRSLRFSHLEYNAVIKPASNDKIDVVLQKTAKESDNRRVIPHCSENDNLLGWEYKVKVNAGFSSESKDQYIGIWKPGYGGNNEKLELVRRFNYVSGIPEIYMWPFLEEPNAIIYNKDITYELQRTDEQGTSIDSPIDVKAQADGRYWRFIADTFNYISYSNVSEEMAQGFDDILDALCVVPMGIDVTGIVTNASGDPVSGVKICDASYNCRLTDENGRYEMALTPKTIIRFSHPLYNAVMKIMPNSLTNTINVTMQKTTSESDNKSIIPRCSENDNLLGWEYKVKTPSNDFTKLEDGWKTALTMQGSRSKDEYLVLRNGIGASSGGMPTPSEWPFWEEQNAILYNRDIEYINQGKHENGIPFSSAINIKAQSDGKFWRFVGDASNVIEYSDVSEETANEFDKILETLCAAPQR